MAYWPNTNNNSTKNSSSINAFSYGEFQDYFYSRIQTCKSHRPYFFALISCMVWNNECTKCIAGLLFTGNLSCHLVPFQNVRRMRSCNNSVVPALRLDIAKI